METYAPADVGGLLSGGSSPSGLDWLGFLRSGPLLSLEWVAKPGWWLHSLSARWVVPRFGCCHIVVMEDWRISGDSGIVCFPRAPTPNSCLFRVTFAFVLTSNLLLSPKTQLLFRVALCFMAFQGSQHWIGFWPKKFAHYFKYMCNEGS